MKRRLASVWVLVLLSAAIGVLAAGWRARTAVLRSGAASGSVARTAARAPASRASRAVAGAPRASSSTRDTQRITLADARDGAPVTAAAAGVLLLGTAETYLSEMAAGGAAAQSRWDDRRGAPVRVWLAAGDSVPGWRPAFDAVVREAFASWARVGLPVGFAFVDAPEDAEVHVTWTERLAEQRAGVTRWTAGADGWLANVMIVLATWASDGTAVDEASVHRIALHEIGHLLGLGHSTDPADIMAPWVRSGELTPRDLATARLLYTLSPAQIADATRLGTPATAVRTPQ